MPDDANAPLVLTAPLDPATEAWPGPLRRARSPPALHRVPAHVTLFHALPGEGIGALALDCATLGVPPARIGLARIGLARFIGRGVAPAVERTALAARRGRLARHVAQHFAS